MLMDGVGVEFRDGVVETLSRDLELMATSTPNVAQLSRLLIGLFERPKADGLQKQVKEAFRFPADQSQV